jgi:mono/diheme cytochrome c family protein/glucose/arabinose dehydrogenase
MKLRWSCFGIIAVISLSGQMQRAHAQFDEDDELVPGVLTEFNGSGQRVEQIDVDISADWGASAPHSRLQPGMFAAEWTTQLLIQQTGQHQFHVFAHGRVSIELDGKTVLEGKADKPQWVSGDEFTPSIGLRPLNVRFQKIGAAARIQLCWSSETFPLEPVPPHLLFREGGRHDLARIQRGRKLFVAHRCARCHSDAESTSRVLPAPDLKRSVAGISTHWLMNKLMGDESARGRMPHFGLNREQAAAIALTLLEAAKTQPPINDKLPKPAKGRDDAKDTASGHTLIKSLGCLACHAVKRLGASGPFAGPDLSVIGEKRTLSWLLRWLKAPASLNANHNMPVFDLTNQERRQLALALNSLQQEIVSPLALGATTPDVLAQGKKLMADLRCAACHGDPRKPEDIPKRARTLGKPVADWTISCLADKPDLAKARPAFPGTDREALQAYLESTGKAASQVSAFEQGREMFEVQNCAACHPRGRSRGVIGGLAAKIAASDASLNGLSTRLVPPSLTGVGDRFRDEALAAAVLGKQPRRLPWLHVRMPKFNPERVDQKMLLAHFIGHDRIADGAPTWKPAPPDQKVSDEELIYGQELVGVKGFSCIACHKVGDYEPRNTAMGTRGSDLLGLRKRMRREHFIRWTRSPLRIVPGLEMPSYTRPAVGSHAKSVDGQLETLWRTLNDSRFESPTNPASVEQFLVVESGQKTRIVRDVFTNPEENGGGYVARSFAMGFPNGHSVLLDLDTLTLRRWTFGDFARQRTVGKSWYWDMAGTDFITRMPTGSDYALVKQGLTGQAALDTAIRPVRSNATVGRLLSYEPVSDQSVELRYRMIFELAGKSLHLDIEELWQGNTDPFEKVNSVSRTIDVKSIPPGYDLLHFVPVTVDNSTFGEPLVGAHDGEHEFVYASQQDRKQRKPVGLKLTPENRHAHVTVNYSTSIRRPSLETRTKPVEAPPAHAVNSMPGFDGIQLPLPQSIMPTAMTVLDDGRLAFTSLKGDVYIARDSDDDGVEDSMTLFEEGLAAPYGIIQDGDSIIVAHKPELLRLRDTDSDGRADERSVFATGWGYNDNYHDWACGIVRNSKGELFIGLGSDYAQTSRPLEYSRWRGKVLRIEPNGTVHPFSHAFRYPTGLAIDSQDRLFGTDNQGVQNTFNEINHLRDGVHYGVPKHHEESLKVDASGPALHVPHPWTRSVNGLQILPESFPAREIAGHGVGAEYNGKLLVRFTYHEVAGQLQGAIYYLSQPNFKDADANFQGPICVTAGPDGELYVGSIHDSGWLGGLNTGSIVKLTARKDRPNGIREIRATSDGFEIRFMRPVDRATAAKPERYTISGYTRVWKGGYGTPDSGRYVPKIGSAKVLPSGDAVHLTVTPLKTGFVYDVTCNLADEKLWPSTGHYTLNRVP